MKPNQVFLFKDIEYRASFLVKLCFGDIKAALISLTESANSYGNHSEPHN